MNIMIDGAKKILYSSMGSIALTSLLAALFALFKKSNLLKTIFNANYIVASVIIVVGLFSFFIPISFRSIKKSNRVVDHSNIADVLKEERDVKTREGLINILWGISNIILIGTLEILIYKFL